MALTDTAAAAPKAQGAAGHKIIQLSGQVPATHTIKGIGIGNIYFVKLLRGAIPSCGHIRFSLAFSFYYSIKSEIFKTNRADVLNTCTILTALNFTYSALPEFSP
jgi:hypothetical protein